MKKDKIHITIDKELSPKIENCRKELGHNKSSFVNYVLTKFFREKEANKGKEKA